ncbi:MAG: ribosome biogenesis GTPase Der [Patescibacteria group bacterium]|nr:ribosome biogenesis GTPase Der [Patescibacteria group bacterium]MDD4610886.1 ribosome biogenesis GTPase Der [Patescibacteria group bacterium]
MENLDKKNLPLVVIFGRTNVGKSTLFNRLTEKNQALISNIEGTTRDANINKINWRGVDFSLVDTGGIMDMKYLSGNKIKTDDIEIKVQKQARNYIMRADLILFLVDNITGLLTQDRQMARILIKDPKIKKKIILVANKVDSQKYLGDTTEFLKLGFGQPATISAANGSGTGDLLDIIVEKISPSQIIAADEETDEEAVRTNLRVAIVGKPNVGKSSLINAILGYERVIVSPVPHTTREPQDTEIEYGNNHIILVDTAGISKHGHKGAGFEKHVMEKSLRALKRANIALLVIDISEPITHQDMKIIEEIVEARKSFLIIANKWDKIEERDTKKFTDYIYNSFPFVAYAPLQFISASTGEKVNKILNLILEINEERKTEIGDSQLNKFLGKIVKIHRPAKGKGDKHPRIFELIQSSANPPKFEIQIGANDTIHNSYLHFIENRLRQKFGFLGTPITIKIKKGRKVHGKADL